MAEEQFGTILTTIGKAKIANSALLGNKLVLKTLKIGDSNGEYYEPIESQTELKHEVYSCDIGSIKIDDKNPNWVKVETILSSSVGGFTIREVGICDADGDLIAISKYPESYKPIIENGAGKDICIRLILEVSNAEQITLDLDFSTIIATKEDVDNLQEQINNNTSQLNDIMNLPEMQSNWDENDATASIQYLIDNGKKVFLSERTYLVSNSILLDNYSKIEGSGFKSIIKLKDNVNKDIIALKSETTKMCTLNNFCIDGNIDNQTDGNGISFNNDFNEAHRHNVRNILIKNVKGIGFYIKGGGDSVVENLSVVYSGSHGVFIDTNDNVCVNISAGSCGGNSLYIKNSNNKIINSKGWWAMKYGIYIDGSRNIISNCDSQDSYLGGYYINGNDNIIKGFVIDQAGARGKDNINANDPVAINLYSGSGNNIEGVITDRKEYTTTGATSYVIQSDYATNNNIDLIFNKITKGIVKTSNVGSKISYNNCNISGTMSDNSNAQYENKNHLSSSITFSENVTTITKNIVHREGRAVQIICSVKGSFSSNTNIGNLPKSCYPIDYLDLQVRCIDSSSNEVGYCVANLTPTGNIILYNVPSSTSEIIIHQCYMTRN